MKPRTAFIAVVLTTLALPGLAQERRQDSNAAHSYTIIETPAAVDTDSDATSPSPAFSALDSDSNGYLSPREAGQNSKLAHQWQKLDKNNDRRLDQSEFSAFEPGKSR